MLIFIPLGALETQKVKKNDWIENLYVLMALEMIKLPKTKQKDKTKKLVLVLISGPSCSLEI